VSRSCRNQATKGKTRPRVLHLIHTLDRGGAEQLLASWFNWVQDSDFQYEVCCLFSGGVHEDSIRKANVPVHIAGLKSPYDLIGLGRAARIIARRRPDIVHTHLRYSDLVGPPLSLLTGCRRVLTTIHNTAPHYFEPGIALSRFEAATYKSISKLFPRYYTAISQAVAEDIKLHLGNNSPIWVVYNAVDCERLRATVDRDRSRVRQELSLAEDTPVYICVGRLEYQKGQHKLLEAFDLVLRRQPQAVLLLVGEGSARPALEQQTAQLSRKENVRFLGKRSDVPALLNAADVFVSAAIYEGFGIALAEAMALGVPVISPRVGGIPEFIENNVTGVLTQPGDWEALAQQMLELHNDEPRRRRLAKAACRYIETNFHISRMVEAYEEIYRHILQE